MVCKYYNKHLDVIREYIGCLYNLEGCNAGGMLHILLDDDNYDDDSIIYCLKECLSNPTKPEATIGKLICEQYLALPMKQRRLLRSEYIGHWSCFRTNDCSKCLIQNGDNLNN